MQVRRDTYRDTYRGKGVRITNIQEVPGIDVGVGLLWVCSEGDIVIAVAVAIALTLTIALAATLALALALALTLAP